MRRSGGGRDQIGPETGRAVATPMIAQDAASLGGAAAASGGDAELMAQLADAAGATVGGFPDFAVGHGLADAYVHEGVTRILKCE